MALSWVVLKALKLDFPRSNAGWANPEIKERKQPRNSIGSLVVTPKLGGAGQGLKLEYGIFLIIFGASQS